MSRPLLLATLVLAFSFVLRDAYAAVMTKRVHSDAAGGDFVVSCDSGPIKADYAPETEAGVPPTDPYAAERGANEGLVRLMSQGGRRTKRYVIPHHLIRAIVRVSFDAVALDRVDLVFTKGDLALVHTATADAGIFTESDVYRLPYSRVGGVDRKPLQQNEDLLQMLDLGLSSYQPGKGGCQ
jgi:hypothetical protein